MSVIDYKNSEDSSTRKNTTGPSDISIKEILIKFNSWISYLISNWKTLLIFGLAFAIGGGIYSYNKKPLYTATTTFVLGGSDAGGGMSQYAGYAAMLGIDMGGSDGGLFQGDNIFQLYKSRIMLQKALLSKYNNTDSLFIDKYIAIHKDAKYYDAFHKLSFVLPQGKSFDRIHNNAIATIVNEINGRYLKVDKVDKKLSLIGVDFKSTDEIFAKEFNLQIVKDVNDFYAETKTKKALLNLAVLQHQTDSVKNVLNNSLYKSVSVSDATPNLNPTKQILRAPIQRMQISVEENKAILVQLVQNLEVAKITLRKDAPLIQVVDTPIIPLPVSFMPVWRGCLIFGILGLILAAFFMSARRLYKNLINT